MFEFAFEEVLFAFQNHSPAFVPSFQLPPHNATR